MYFLLVKSLKYSILLHQIFIYAAYFLSLSFSLCHIFKYFIAIKSIIKLKYFLTYLQSCVWGKLVFVCSISTCATSYKEPKNKKFVTQRVCLLLCTLYLRKFSKPIKLAGKFGSSFLCQARRSCLKSAGRFCSLWNDGSEGDQ